MQKKCSIVSLAIILCLLILSCERLPNQPVGADFIDLASIPASYGNLVAVTSIQVFPGWVQMWFQDNIGTIRVVRVRFSDYRMAKDVKEIARN